ncbi:hypothetical protein P0L94_10540 [Microbacter sp. GSS18]|nr:hypothetical protein P0L94_10540 [Microbacter sp. GSS18]
MRSARLWGTAAATALLAAALLAWAVVTPGFRAPDEPNHVSAVIDLALEGEWAEPNTAPLDSGMRASYEWFGFPGVSKMFSDGGPVSAAMLPPDAPSLAELRGGPAPEIDAEQTNQITQHPPLYYAYLALWLHAFSLDEAPVTTMLLVLRLASALLLLPIPALLAWTATRIGLPPTAALIAAVVPAAWVQFTHIGATVNNGALLVLASTVFLAMLVRVVTGDLRMRIAVIAGAALAVALLTKGFALALAPLGPVAYLWRWRADRARIWRPFIVAAAIALTGFSFYVYTLMQYGTLATVSRATEFTYTWDRFAGWTVAFVEEVSKSMWMNLGWLETPLRPSILHYAVSIGALALIVYGSWLLRRSPGLVVILNGAWVLTLIMFAIPSLRTWLWNETIRAAQGRYLQQAVLALAILIAVALARPRWISLAAPGVAAAAVVGGLWWGTRHFWVSEALFDPADAWPAGRIILGIAGILLMAGTAVATGAALRLPYAPLKT